MKIKLLPFFLILISSIHAQDLSSESVLSFKKKVVIYTDFGFNSAPFRLDYPFESDLTTLKFRNNYNPSIGLGFAHKWLALRFNFMLKGTQRSESRYGDTKAFNFGVNFQIKQVYTDIDLRQYSGYAIKDAFEWNDSLNALKPNDLRPSTSTISFSIQSWLFLNKDWKMSAFNGQTAHFIKPCQTFFFKPSFSVYGVNNGIRELIPTELQKVEDSKTKVININSIEIGAVTGYAVAHRWQHFQVAGFLGFGPVIQAKSYGFTTFNRSFLGLTPRSDFRFSLGYSNRKFFSFLIGDFENKSIRFNKLKYKQTYYSLRLSVGYRLDKKEKIKPKT